MKIVILDGYGANPGDLSWEGLEALGELIVYDRTPRELVAERMAGAEAVFTNKSLIDDVAMAACPDLKFIGVLATGYNVVDTAAARKRGIAVCNVPAYSTPDVVQMTMALLLEICLHVGHHSDEVHKGRWQNNADFCFWDTPLIEISGKTLGIIGYGTIGKAVARVAAAFGMKVLVTGRPGKAVEAEACCTAVTLEELLAQSDVVSLHCPLTADNQGLICKETIAKMKDGAILLNTGRGPLLNEQDVADALNSGKLYAAGVDVVSAEPIKAENPLLQAKNCIITPHIAWATEEARKRLLAVSVSNLEAFLAGKPVNVVN
ncbi:MAG: D-2-hydroxyacid dehydrogenase [Clostridiales bacterium]|nr:D-2-hydroxyacid dehydrogenase [Clostridiales bacterium]